jgi:hypothetical protein
MGSLRTLTIAVLIGALFALPGCLSGDSGRAKERTKYWSRIEKKAAGRYSERPKSFNQEKRQKPRTRNKEGKARKNGKLAASRGLLETLLEHGWLVRVKPWERDVLALEQMSWDPDSLQAQRRSHVYFSKESSLLGGGAGGGGCGCN